jgi:hypothetical protein
MNIGRGGACIAGLALQFGLGEIAVAEQSEIEIAVIGSHFAYRLGLAVGDVGADAERQVVEGDLMPGLRQAAGVIADDVVAQPACGPGIRAGCRGQTRKSRWC